MTTPPPAPPHAPGERVITGEQHRAARQLTVDQRRRLEVSTCAERVILIVGSLIADRDGWFRTEDLRAATHDVDLVDVALDVLTDAGLGCGDA